MLLESKSMASLSRSKSCWFAVYSALAPNWQLSIRWKCVITRNFASKSCQLGELSIRWKCVITRNPKNRLSIIRFFLIFSKWLLRGPWLDLRCFSCFIIPYIKLKDNNGSFYLNLQISSGVTFVSATRFISNRWVNLLSWVWKIHDHVVSCPQAIFKSFSQKWCFE